MDSNTHLALGHRVKLFVLGVTEIADFQQRHTVAIQERVFKLDVAVYDVAAVAVVEGDDELLKVPPGLCFTQATLGRHVMKHVTAGCVLEDDGEVFGREKDALEGNDMRMNERTVVEDLTLDVFGDIPSPFLYTGRDVFVVL